MGEQWPFLLPSRFILPFGKSSQPHANLPICLSAGQLVSHTPGGVVEGSLLTFFFSLHLLETKYGGHRVRNEGSFIVPNLLTSPL